MAHLTLAGYQFGRSWLHRLDLRYKIPMLVLLSLTIMATNLTGLALLSLLLLILLNHLAKNSNLHPGRLFIELRWFYVFLLFVGATRLLAEGVGPETASGFFQPTWPALQAAVQLCWQLGLVALYGLLFATTSRSVEIRAALIWFLSPFPFIPAHRIALMISLMVRFIPLILQEAHLLMEARQARLMDLRRNPLYRLTSFGSALLRRTFVKADRLVDALEARCFSERHHYPLPPCGYQEWRTLLPLTVLCSFLATF